MFLDSNSGGGARALANASAPFHPENRRRQAAETRRVRRGGQDDRRRLRQPREKTRERTRRKTRIEVVDPEERRLAGSVADDPPLRDLGQGQESVDFAGRCPALEGPPAPAPDQVVSVRPGQ